MYLRIDKGADSAAAQHDEDSEQQQTWKEQAPEFYVAIQSFRFRLLQATHHTIEAMSVCSL